ncbi:hypothetical protein H4217_006909 [Coemansia sp. RSA 1939]|nr:hypothetical protein H4217_006909 [Coemansia sp. RSA 1939]KAJ2614479.1 hypothetical protein EV177_002047 [Coemansia sp. RSA 1804]
MAAAQSFANSVEKAGSTTPILSWNNLNYDVKVKTGTRRLLHDITGSIHPGEVVAIMGASGAGKTTLLNVLSGRVQGGKLFGHIKFNGAKRNPHDFKRMLAYVEQDDMMHATLTVRETLTVSARLRLPSDKYTDEEKLKRVDDVMRQLRLSHIADTMIGGGGMRGVSGGERKRVSIGIELVTDPSILVLDEPSSGLDSSSAEMVVKLTKSMARERNLGTLMTIHQPSTEMMAEFDKLILLSQGKLVYAGPADQALRYFEQLGHPSTNSNPANFYIDLMTVDFSSSDAMSKDEARVQSLVDSFVEYRNNGSRLLTHNNSGIAGASSSAASTHYSGEIGEHKDGSEPSSTSLAKNSEYEGLHSKVDNDITEETASIALYEPPSRNGWFEELFVLLRRDWTLTIRNRSLLTGFAFQCFMLTIFMSFVFFQLKKNQASVQNRVGALFMLVIQTTFPVTIPTMTVVMVGRGVLMRERSTGTYRMSTYYVARALCFYPLVTLTFFIMYTGMYFISHFQYDAGKYFIGLALVIIILYTAIGFGFTIAMLMSNLETAHIVTPVTFSTLFLFAGNLSNSHAVTPVLRWIKYICIFYYPYSALMQNEFNGLEFTCDSSSVSCYKTGQEVLDSYGLNELPIWADVVIELALGTFLYIVGYIGLRWVTKPRYLWL